MMNLDLIEARVRAAACDDVTSISEEHARKVLLAEFGEQEIANTSLFILQHAAHYTGQKRLVQDALVLLREAKRIAHDPDEVHEIRVQPDYKLYLSGSIESIVREAFKAGYECCQSDSGLDLVERR